MSLIRYIRRFLRKSKRWKFLGEGSTRRAYLLPSGRRVIKLPLDCYGVEANEGEIRQSRQDITGRLARCRPFIYKGQLCSIMQYVEPVKTEDRPTLPDWCYGIDCTQVGHTRKGKLVAYDWYTRYH